MVEYYIVSDSSLHTGKNILEMKKVQFMLRVQVSGCDYFLFAFY